MVLQHRNQLRSAISISEWSSFEIKPPVRNGFAQSPVSTPALPVGKQCPGLKYAARASRRSGTAPRWMQADHRLASLLTAANSGQNCSRREGTTKSMGQARLILRQGHRSPLSLRRLCRRGGRSSPLTARDADHQACVALFQVPQQIWRDASRSFHRDQLGYTA